MCVTIALKVFGENCDLIHSVVFDKAARKRYANIEDFSERSIVQLKKKYKKEADTIDSLLKDKKPSENIAWFEKKYGIDILKFDKARQEELSDTSSASSHIEALSEDAELSQGPISAGLISATGITAAKR